MVNKPFLLSIDQSISCTGWCFFDINSKKLIDFGCIKTKKDEGDLYARCRMIANSLNLFIKEGNTQFVREGLGFGGSKSNASRDLAYLVGYLENEVTSPMGEIAPTRLKKYATGSGKADKQAMIDALPEEIRTAFSLKNFKKTTGLADLADAYFIGQYFMEEGYDF